MYPEPVELPHEILLIIFRNALPPRWLLHGERALPPHPRSISSYDLRMKLSILAVCKTWNQVGTELLYESVTLRRIGQLPAFVRALEGREGVGALVAHLDISYYVPPGYSSLHQSDTNKIFWLCPNLSHLGFIWSCTIPALPLPPLSSSITSLEYSDAMPLSDILPSLIQLRQNLRSLSINLTPFSHSDPEITFENLEDLRLCFSFEKDFADPATKWSMPRLQRIWFTATGTDFAHKFMDIFKQFFDVCGPKLTFLSVDSIVHGPQEILDRCPALEHLVILSHIAGPWQHGALKYVDFWRPDFPAVQRGQSFDSLKTALPLLRTVRNLDKTFDCLWDLPVRMPPTQNDVGPEEDQEDSDDSQDSSSFWDYAVWSAVREFADPDSIQGEVVESDEDDCIEEDRDEDKDSVDDCDSDSGSCITVSDELYEDMEMDEQIGHDQALEIFSRVV
ncbi:hypothetical protein B0H10DRAFT_2000419 [Mycena sp. CBHHK59/15]|nr:hypothetical protein B0H10DRAFT_2000419 [Mycena sp. CBHHK59/15]